MHLKARKDVIEASPKKLEKFSKKPIELPSDRWNFFFQLCRGGHNWTGTSRVTSAVVSWQPVFSSKQLQAAVSDINY